MVEIIEVNGEKKIKIGTVKVRINNTVLVELNHYQGDTLQSIEEAALKQSYDGNFAWPSMREALRLFAPDLLLMLPGL